MASPFEILGIDQDADDAEIVRAYRRRVKETHPDLGGSTSEFRAVRTAYERIQAGSRSEEGVRDVERESVAERQGPEEPQVEYLNYEVLDDYGWGLDDEDLFEKASDADLDPSDEGRIRVHSHESLLEAAENRGFAWPYACRGGACANCAVAVVEGEMDMPANHVLSPKMTERGIQLSCVGTPTTDRTKVVYNVKHMPDLDDLLLPPNRFEQAHSDD